MRGEGVETFSEFKGAELLDGRPPYLAARPQSQIAQTNSQFAKTPGVDAGRISEASAGGWH
jgi:hypothetical protein|tara:strand:- start:790 stop:972 length:183 start_codon:yes stop_codon:yes gene_type:complete